MPQARADDLAGLRLHDVDDGSLDVDVHAGPILVGDHLDDALEVGGVGDLVLGLAEDDADEAGLFAEVLEGLAVVTRRHHCTAVFVAPPWAVILGLRDALTALWLKVGSVDLLDQR